MTDDMTYIHSVVNDLTGEEGNHYYPARTIDHIPDSLWEGFVYDIQQELGLPELSITSDMTVGDIADQALELRGKKEEDTPEMTLVIHLDDEVVNSVLDDMESVLERYNMPFAMTAYVPKNGKMVRQPLRRASDTDIFKYHEKVMDMFKK